MLSDFRLYGVLIVMLLLAGCDNCPAVGCPPNMTITFSDELVRLGDVVIELEGKPFHCPSSQCVITYPESGGAVYSLSQHVSHIDIFIVDENETVIEHFERSPEYHRSETLVFPNCNEYCQDYASLDLP